MITNNNHGTTTKAPVAAGVYDYVIDCKSKQQQQQKQPGRQAAAAAAAADLASDRKRPTFLKEKGDDDDNTDHRGVDKREREREHTYKLTCIYIHILEECGLLGERERKGTDLP